jgi:hypothetical protein
MTRSSLLLILPFTALALVCGGAEQNPQKPQAPLPANQSLANLATNASDWEKQRVEIKKAWNQLLGELPKVKAPLLPETKSTERLNGFSRSLVKYQVEPGVFTDGYLLEPVSLTGRAPAVIVFHPTTPLQAKGVAGVDPSYDEEKQQGVHLVKRGFVVWCPRNYINEDGADWAGNARRVMAAHPGWTGMTRMTWDAVRAADYVQSLKNVDGDRLGCIGHSLGAKVVLFAMAFDDRYKVGVFSEGGIGLKFSNWDAPWYLGPKIREPGFLLDTHQLLALIAPRSFLLLAGDSADGDTSLQYIEAVLPVYQALHKPQNIGGFNHHRGHRYPPEARAVAEEFLVRELKGLPEKARPGEGK